MPPPPANTEDLFRIVIDEIRDFAFLLIDVDGKVMSWNAGAQRIFGYAEEEIVGQSVAAIFTPEDQAAGAPAAELATALRTGRAPDTRWHQRKDGRRLFVDGVTTTLYDDGKLIGFSKIVRDVTDRFLGEQRLGLQLSLSKLFATDQPIETMARHVMQTICETLSWDIGALWVVRGDTIRMTDFWQAGVIDEALANRLAEDRTEFVRGNGLPGRVWESAQAVWIPDILADPNFPRASLARAFGIHSALGFPIIRNGAVTGVMEFFSREMKELDSGLPPLLMLIGAQIGDYVERRRTAEALAASEARYRVISQTATDAILTIDDESRILFVNSAAEEMFGYSAEELVGSSLDRLMPERYRAAHVAGIAHYLQTHVRNIPWKAVQLPGLHRDGHEIPLELSFGEWTEDGRTVFSGFARDVSEREAAAASMREALAHEQQARSEAEAARAQLERRANEEASFRHLASALTGAAEMADVLAEITNRATLVTRADGVYIERIIDDNERVHVVSSAGRGVPPRGTSVMYPGSLTEEIMRSPQPVILADMRSFGRAMAPYLGDTCADCQVLVTPLVAEEEVLGALVLLNSGESGRHFGEGDIVRARTLGDMTSLALRRVRLLEEERRAKEVAEAAVRVRDETLGIVSHDLRNPLTTIALSADLLLGAPPEEQRELIATVRAAAGQMQRLIQDLLDVARVESGRLSVRTERIDLAPALRQACDSNEALAAKKNLRLECAVPESLPPVLADRDRIVQILGNLIGNALKFTPEGGVIRVTATNRPHDLLFEVRDTGPGLPESDLKNVFRPYWQAKKTAHMGAGLGLAIVRGIVEAHGGTARACNAPQGGAVFTFTIPKE